MQEIVLNGLHSIVALSVTLWRMYCSWAKEMYGIVVRFCCGVSDASSALHGGLVYKIVPAQESDGVEFKVSDEERCNYDGSIIEYGTDCVHVKRKYGTEKTTGFDPETRQLFQGHLDRMIESRTEEQVLTLGKLVIKEWKVP